MKKIFKNLINVLLIILMILVITACDKWYYSSGIIKHESGVNDINYNSIYKKVWISENWSGSNYDNLLSIRFEDISNLSKEKKDAIKESLSYLEQFNSNNLDKALLGEISYGSLVLPETNNYKYNSISEEKIQFCADIVADSIECSVCGDNNSFMTVKYISDNKISVKINNVDKFPKEWNLNKGETYYLKCYNISDIEVSEIPEYRMIEKNSFDIELDYWGQVKLVIMQFLSNKPRPYIYLTDKDKNILYSFSLSFHTGTEIFDIKVEDLNDDGLKDISIITCFTEDKNMPYIEWILYQNERGYFDFGYAKEVKF